MNELRPNLKNWSSNLKLIKRIPMKDFNKACEKTNYVKFQFTDGTNCVEAVAFGKEAVKYDKELELNYFYSIENAQIDPINDKLRTFLNYVKLT